MAILRANEIREMEDDEIEEHDKTHHSQDFNDSKRKGKEKLIYFYMLFI